MTLEEKVQELETSLTVLAETSHAAFIFLHTEITPLFEYAKQAGEACIYLVQCVQQLEAKIQDRQTLEARIDVLEGLIEVLMCGRKQ